LFWMSQRQAIYKKQSAKMTNLELHKFTQCMLKNFVSTGAFLLNQFLDSRQRNLLSYF